MNFSFKRLWSLFMLFCCGMVLVSCKKKEEKQLPIVIVDKPVKKDMQIYGEYVGSIKAESFVEIHARVEGYLESLLFEEGKMVHQGDPLFIISPALYKAKAAKAKAQLKKNQVQAAKAARDVERLTPLYEQHAASQLDLDNAIAAKENAEADIAMSEADLEQANLELSYTRVTSPITILPNPNRKLLPGQSTRVKLLLDVRERAIVVPRKALSVEKGGAFIYVIRRDDVAEKRFVQIGPEVENSVVIERGLGENERVVVEGYHKLVPNMKVHPVSSYDDKAIQLLREKEEE